MKPIYFVTLLIALFILGFIGANSFAEAQAPRTTAQRAHGMCINCHTPEPHQFLNRNGNLEVGRTPSDYTWTSRKHPHVCVSCHLIAPRPGAPGPMRGSIKINRRRSPTIMHDLRKQEVYLESAPHIRYGKDLFGNQRK